MFDMFDMFIAQHSGGVVGYFNGVRLLSNTKTSAGRERGDAEMRGARGSHHEILLPVSIGSRLRMFGCTVQYLFPSSLPAGLWWRYYNWVSSTQQREATATTTATTHQRLPQQWASKYTPQPSRIEAKRYAAPAPREVTAAK